jgi:6-pyruvoyltetrahydropterin/6-carboxytetrahydropterin synthase
MEAEVIRTFRFDAAHRLPHVPAGHRCANLHGHSYRVDVHVAGPVDPRTGWVMDFGRIRQLVEPVLAVLDHRCLNDINGLENSTSEMIAQFLFDRLAPQLPGLSAVTVWESENARCVYRGR